MPSLILHCTVSGANFFFLSSVCCCCCCFSFSSPRQSPNFPHFKLRTVPSNLFPLISQMDSIGINAFDDGGGGLGVDDDDILRVSALPTHFFTQRTYVLHHSLGVYYWLPFLDSAFYLSSSSPCSLNRTKFLLELNHNMYVLLIFNCNHK